MGNTLNACIVPNEPSEKPKSETKILKKNDTFEETGSEIKLLLLGSGESGKSTVFRQIQKILAQLSKEEISTFVPNIYENIWRMTHDCVMTYKEQYQNTSFSSTEAKKAADLVLKFSEDYGEFKDGYGYTQQVYDSILTLWKDEKFVSHFQKCKGTKFHVNDGYEYLFHKDNLVRFKPQPQYLPSFDDMIQSRKKTIGINKIKFQLKKRDFIITDVGGQRSERKKWLAAFENVSVLIFVASLGDFNQTLYEDDVTNRMHEAIELFEKVINNSFFLHQRIILLLNKEDMLKEKLKTSKLSECFDDYKGNNDYKSAVEFITQKFLEQNRGEKDRITVKTIQGTNTETVSNIFEEIKESLAKQFN